MALRLLLSIWLIAAAVRAEATWAVDPEQALLTVDGPPFSAFSHRLTGRLLEQEGTLTIRGVTQPVRITLVLARLNAMTFGHASILVHLRDFGFPLPAGMRDAARIEVDTGLRLEHALASSG